MDVYRGGWRHQGVTFTTPSRQVLPTVVLSWAIYMAALFVLGLNLVAGKVVRITRTLKASTPLPVLYLDKDIVKLPGLTEVAVHVFDGVSDITSESLPQTYSVSTSYMWCNAKESVRVLHCEVLDGKFCMDEQDKTFIKTKLPAFMENERERIRREKEEKLEKIR